MDGEAKMADAMREELASRADQLRKRLKKAHRGSAQGVHKARTELRRIRVELGTMGHTAFDPRVTTKLEDRLRDVERALAKTRDTDVLLSDVRAHRDLRKVCKRLEQRRRRSAKRARKALDRKTRRALDTRLRRAAKPKHVAIGKSKNPAYAAPMLVRHFTHREVWRRYDTLRAYDACLPADVATLHKLRSACRELRYTLEAFQPALPGLEPIARALHALQDEMGELHDHQVAIDLLGRWRRKKKIASTEALERYLARRAEARDELRSRSEPRWLGVLGESFRLELARALEPHAEITSPRIAA
ncbi:MAG TPA: CHAD domain-containing protein [Polyangiaceae bacterium]|jgi:CHAD domain-containing protein